NNMLGVILGHAEMALESMDINQPEYHDLKEIHKAAERSAKLTRQLLGFASKQTIAPRVLDLNETIEGMFTMLRRLIGEDIDLTWHPDPGLWNVRVDPGQVDQILANLLINSRDAISGVGSVTIETKNISIDCEGQRDLQFSTPGEYVVLTVKDDGEGMDKQTLDQVFDPFYTTKEIGKGVGLGLATVYGIIKQNEGFIEVNSEPLKGTTFDIFLPRYSGSAGEAMSQPGKNTLYRGQETILLVEDEEAILKMACKMLEMFGYRVLTATRPGEALHLVERYGRNIKLLMTDVVMPEMNGWDLAESITKIHPDIRCLFMSGYTADEVAHRGVLDQRMNFIQKPFTQNDLAAKVRRALKGLPTS
ncbi:MAG: ATP-binding protein, partial [Desulforhopalus sp.]